MSKNVLLMILDGWGIASNPEVSAIDRASTPFIDSLYTKYPNATLLTDSMNVGLPDGQMGNSEVGHMNLGAGRIVYQDLAKINLAIKNNTLKDEEVLKNTFEYVKDNNKKIHFLGLLSDGGVHSHINHLKGLLKAADDFGLENVFVHAFTDGRDVDPKSGKGFVRDIQDFCERSNAKLASIIGRYYAMDRDQRWERTKLAYQLLVEGKGASYEDPVKAVKESYKSGITDEFIKPVVICDTNKSPVTVIEEGDAVVFFNFRTDRGRQLSQAISQKDFHEYNMHKIPLYFVTMTNYDVTFKGVHVIYEKDNITNTLGETIASKGKNQIRIAETEKYPHVTFFFNGGREEPFNNEKRILCPSPKVATYDLQPEMSAVEITDKIIPELDKKWANFICLNFANPDMVGHTGDMNAAIKACETVDQCTEKVVSCALKNNYTTIIIADHGNCDVMINPDGSPNTAHTTNPVPLIIVDKDFKKVKSGILGDIAPTILKLMGISQPDEMTQKSLI